MWPAEEQSVRVQWRSALSDACCLTRQDLREESRSGNIGVSPQDRASLRDKDRIGICVKLEPNCTNVRTYTRTKLRGKSCWETDNGHYFSFLVAKTLDKMASGWVIKTYKEVRNISFLPSKIVLNNSATFELCQHTHTHTQAKRGGTSRRHDQPNSTDHAVLVPNWKTQQKHFSRTSEWKLAGAAPEG